MTGQLKAKGSGWVRRGRLVSADAVSLDAGRAQECCRELRWRERGGVPEQQMTRRLPTERRSCEGERKKEWTDSKNGSGLPWFGLHPCAVQRHRLQHQYVF